MLSGRLRISVSPLDQNKDSEVRSLCGQLGDTMESFESLVALAMQAENLLVSGPTKFKLKMPAKNGVEQEHGYEVDLIGMRQDKLVLATVKSFLGSGGVRPKEVTGEKGAEASKGYKMLNNRVLRSKMIDAACAIYGYKPEQVELRLYAGGFAGKNGEAEVRDWCSKETAGGGPIEVFSLLEIMERVEALAKSKTYIDDPALVAVKAMLIASELSNKPAKGSKLQDEYSRTQVARDFPVGARVFAATGSVVGFVVGYSNQHSSKPYVKIRDEETGIVWIRSAATCKVLDSHD